MFFLHDVKPNYVAMAEPHTPQARGLKRRYERDSEKCNCCRAKKTKVRSAPARLAGPQTEFNFCSASHTIEIGLKEKSVFRANEADRHVDQMFPSMRTQACLTLPTLALSYHDQQPSNMRTSPRALPLMTDRTPSKLSTMRSLQMWNR